MPPQALSLLHHSYSTTLPLHFPAGVFEVWLHPSRYRTQPCKDAPHCTRHVCFFAHTLEEVRQVEPEDLTLLEHGSDASSAGSVNQLALDLDSDSSSTLLDSSSSKPGSPPRCGANTNSKALAQTAVAASKASSGSSTRSSGSKSAGLNAPPGPCDWGSAASLSKFMSRQGSSNSTVASQFSGLESWSSLGSALGTPAVAATAAASLLSGNLQQQGFSQGLLANDSNRLLSVPADIAMEAAMLRAAAGIAPLCDIFGSLDLNHQTPNPAMAAAPSGVAAMGHTPFEALANMGGWTIGLPTPHSAVGAIQKLGSIDSSGLGNMANPAMAPAAAMSAHQAVAAQHQNMQDLLQTVLMQQRREQMIHVRKQQHHNAMWAAAYQAAAEVGLDGPTAAACADAAVANTEAQSAAAKQHAASQQLQLLLHQQHSNPMSAAQLGLLPGAPLDNQQPNALPSALPAPIGFDEQQQLHALMLQQANMLGQGGKDASLTFGAKQQVDRFAASAAMTGFGVLGVGPHLPMSSASAAFGNLHSN
eukprot:GHRR01006425.1.p1 GENE.GHRR01006425.1~~GHRR01006425.1.p1  ORF type:complete len:532 (+),score=218.69 GHRR01006425.1:908-2503(+)